MLARDVMTTEVVTVTPQMGLEALARLFLEKRVSAVPVVSDEGRILGVVSESDLIFRLRSPRRKKWWLTLLVGGKNPATEFVRMHGKRVEDVMRQPAMTVTEETPVEEIARILEEEKIKRVPVVRDGRVLGIVSRRDLIRGLAMREEAVPAGLAPTDAEIYRRITQQLKQVDWLQGSAVQVGVADGIVHLMGFVADADVRRAVQLLVQNSPGIRGVEDRLLHSKPASYTG